MTPAGARGTHTAPAQALGPGNCSHAVGASPPGVADPHARRASSCTCLLCGTEVASRDLPSAWERAFFGRVADTTLAAWGYGDMAAWAGDDAIAYRASGGLAAWTERHDLLLDAHVAENTRRIQQIADFVRQLRVAAPAAKANELEFTIHAWAAVVLTNAIFVRAGDYDAVIRPFTPRRHPFTGYRAAMTACMLQTFAAPTLAPISRGPSGVETTPLRGGVVFDEMSAHPTRSSTGHAPSVAVENRVSVIRSVERARLGQHHILVTPAPPTELPRRTPCALCALTLEPGPAPYPRCLDDRGHRVWEPTHDRARILPPLSPVHLELLRLVDVGLERVSARIENKSVIPAIDPLRVRDALTELRHGRAATITEHEARLMIKAARAAIVDQLRIDGLIPPESANPSAGRGSRSNPTTEDAPRRPSTSRRDPFALPGA